VVVVSRPNLSFPHQCADGQIQWLTPTYTAIRNILSNPVYAGAYAYGKSRQERYVDESGKLQKRTHRLPLAQWPVLLKDHHAGFIDWAAFEMNQARLARNLRPGPQQAAGVVREGSALLQGLATCGRCGRKLRVYYQGQHSSPGYYCANSQPCGGRAVWCLRVGAVRIGPPPSPKPFWRRLAPAGNWEAALEAEKLSESEQQTALQQLAAPDRARPLRGGASRTRYRKWTGKSFGGPHPESEWESD